MITKIPHNIGISELRANLTKYIKSAKSEPVIISANRGKELRVIVDVALYNELIEHYEDSLDAFTLTNLVKKDDGQRINFKSPAKK